MPEKYYGDEILAQHGALSFYTSLHQLLTSTHPAQGSFVFQSCPPTCYFSISAARNLQCSISQIVPTHSYWHHFFRLS